MNLIDVDAAAVQLGMSTSWLYKKTSTGSIPFVKIGTAVRFDPAQLRAWLQQHSIEMLDADGKRPAPPPVSGEPALTLERAAATLCMSASWLYKVTAAGLVPHFKIGAAVRFDPARLRAWAAARSSGQLTGCR